MNLQNWMIQMTLLYLDFMILKGASKVYIFQENARNMLHRAICEIANKWSFFRPRYRPQEFDQYSLLTLNFTSW